MNTIKALMAILIISMISTSALAETAEALLAQGIYQEETVGDLDKASKIYRQILAKSDIAKPYLAEAAYRDAHILYLRKDTLQATTALNTLLKDFPNQTAFVNKAHNLLGAITRDATTLLDAPWGDFETSIYTLISPAGAKIGDVSFVVRNEVENGQSQWHIDQFTSMPINQVQEFSRTTLNRNWEQHLTGELSSLQHGDISYTFGNGKVVYVQDKDNKKSTTTIELPNAVYDGKLIPVLLRRLPLVEGYQLSTPVFDAATATAMQADIKVTAVHDKIEVQSQNYEAYEVKITTSQSGAVARSVTALVERGNDRKLLRLKHDFGSIEYTGQHTSRAQRQHTFKTGSKTFKVSSPAYWQAFDIANLDPSMEHSQLYVAPRAKASTTLAVVKFPTSERGSLSPKKIVDGDVTALKSYFKDYTIRDNSRKDLKVSGLPAQFFVADFNLMGKAMVESRIYILGESRIYWFILRVEKKNYDASKAAFEEQYTSFTL